MKIFAFVSLVCLVSACGADDAVKFTASAVFDNTEIAIKMAGKWEPEETSCKGNPAPLEISPTGSCRIGGQYSVKRSCNIIWTAGGVAKICSGGECTNEATVIVTDSSLTFMSPACALTFKKVK